MRIASNLSDDINRLGAERAIHSIAIEGSVGFSRFVNHNMERFRILGSLVKIDLHLEPGGGFARTVLRSLGVDFPLKSSDETQRMIEQVKNLSPAVVRRSYDIYRLDPDLLILLFSR
jgi:hypothetical protein